MDKTLLKGLDVLQALACSQTARGVSELAQELGLTRSNAHRTLQTLVSAGYARQDRSGNYECTLKLFELANAVLSRMDITRVAEPFIKELAEKTKETVHLSVLDGLDVVYLQKIDSPQPVRAYSSIGGRSPAYCVATGKALLAHQDPAYLGKFAGRLEAFTPRTITSLAKLSEELEQVRRQGYAVNRGEWRESVGGLAAPVFDAASRPVAGVGISGPTERLRPTTIRTFSRDVITAARGISRALGYTRPGLEAHT
jgi:IclR family KDG regulon transcriptional repressor